MIPATTQDALVSLSTLMNVAELPEPISILVRRCCDRNVLVHVHADEAMAWRGAIDGALPWTRRRASVGMMCTTTGSFRGLSITVTYFEPASSEVSA